MNFNNEIVRTVIDINNRCMEQHRQVLSHQNESLPDGYGGVEDRIQYCKRVLSALQSAIALIKRNIIDSSTPCHHQEQQHPSTLMASSTVHIKFRPPEVDSLLSTPSPIVICCNPILLDVGGTTGHDYDDESGTGFTFSTDDIHLISMTLLFNMGLTCHRSIAALDGSNYFMTQAMKIYELLIGLCIQCTSNTNNSRYSIPMMTMKRMIQMMTYNNYGQICYELGLYPHYQMCMNYIQSTLPTTSDNTTNSTTVEGWSRLIYNELRLNVIVYELHPVPMMASAA